VTARCRHGAHDRLEPGSGTGRDRTFGLGIQVSHEGRVIGATDDTVDSRWYLGRWLRARDWETTAVPELRMHATRLAQRLASIRALALSA